ncbi:MAG: NAD(P)H-hydrate dehydratase, partial [Ruthenibacterium lactatiformans]
MPAVITNEMVFAALPPRPPESHKGAYGRVLAVCGCPAYRGAAALSVLGALRAGAGVVTLAAGESVIQSIAARVLEATFLPLPDESALASMAETATVCLAGCGREADETTAREMKFLLERTRGTVVLDAGGLCSLAAEKQAMRPAAGRLIVTPHPGEMARLAHTSV